MKGNKYSSGWQKGVLSYRSWQYYDQNYGWITMEGNYQERINELLTNEGETITMVVDLNKMQVSWKNDKVTTTIKLTSSFEKKKLFVFITSGFVGQSLELM